MLRFQPINLPLCFTQTQALSLKTSNNRIREERSDGRSRTLIYNEFNQLIEVRDFDHTLTRFTYDGLGNRLSEFTSRVHTIFPIHEVEESMDVLVNRLRLAQTEEFGQLCLLAFYNSENLPTLEDLPIYITEELRNVLVRERRTTTLTYETIDWWTETVMIYFINDINHVNTQVMTSIRNGYASNYIFGTRRIASSNIIYVYDMLGNVIIDLSHQGTLLRSYNYTAYGRRDIVFNPFIATSSRYGYRGEAHTSFEFQFLRARFYDTVAEVFIQEDLYVGELNDPLSRNRYTYVLNNPFKWIDPTGRNAEHNVNGGGSGTPWELSNGMVVHVFNGRQQPFTGFWSAAGRWFTEGWARHNRVGSRYYTWGVVRNGNNVAPTGRNYVNGIPETPRPPQQPIPEYPEGPRDNHCPYWQNVYYYYNHNIQVTAPPSHTPPIIQPETPTIAMPSCGELQALIAQTAAHLGISEYAMLQLLHLEIFYGKLFNSKNLYERIRDICYFYLGWIDIHGRETGLRPNPGDNSQGNSGDNGSGTLTTIERQRIQEAARYWLDLLLLMLWFPGTPLTVKEIDVLRDKALSDIIANRGRALVDEAFQLELQRLLDERGPQLEELAGRIALGALLSMVAFVLPLGKLATILVSIILSIATGTPIDTAVSDALILAGISSTTLAILQIMGFASNAATKLVLIIGIALTIYTLWYLDAGGFRTFLRRITDSLGGTVVNATQLRLEEIERIRYYFYKSELSDNFRSFEEFWNWLPGR